MWTKILSNIMYIAGLRIWLVLLITTANMTIIYNAAARAEHPALEDSNEAIGTDLIAKLRNDANLDLSIDEEYEDLRAELLAYHTTLAKLSAAAAGSRRSLSSTPCWKLDGICINYKLCTGFRYLTQVPGCRGRLNVCCFTWNRSRVRDHREHDVYVPVYPWSHQYEFGGKGILGNDPRNDNTTTSENVKNSQKLKGVQENVNFDEIEVEGLGKKVDDSVKASSSSEVVINKSVHPNSNAGIRRSFKQNHKSGLEVEDNDKDAQKTWKIIMLKTF